MDFTLTEEQRMFRQMFADFAAKEVAPLAETLDKEERPPMETLRKAAEQGFMGALLPEEPYFGAELDGISYALLLEELGKHCLSTALTLHVHNGLAARTILLHGTEEQKDRYLPAMAEGTLIGAFALTEPEAGSDAASLRTRAVLDGDEYVLTGRKTWVANGGIAGLFIIFARTGKPGPKGISGFLVERETPGFKVGGREKTLGLRGLTCHRLYLDDCRVPATNRLGEEGQGFRIAMQTLDFARVSVAAICLGAAEAALELGAQYATERVQFARPIAQFQAIQNYVADTAMEVEALRYLVYHAAWLADQDEPYTYDAAIAKLFGSLVARRAANKMLQVHGGYGYMKEYAIERIYRDCRALEIIEGTSEIHRYVIARKLFADRGLAIKL